MASSVVSVKEREIVCKEEAQPERFQVGRVFPLAAGHCVHDTYTGFLAPLLPEFIEKLALSKTEAGLLTVFVRIPSLLQPFIGYLADRKSLRFLVILAPLVTAVMMSLLGIAPTYAVLALFLSVAGVSSACIHAVGPAIAGKLSGKHLGQGMGLWMLFGELGRVLGPLVVAAALTYLGLQGLPWLMLGGILSSLVLFLLLRNVPHHAVDVQPSLDWRAALREMSPFLLLMVGLVTVRSFMSESLTTYLPIFLWEKGTDVRLAGVALSIFEAAGMLGAFVGGTLSDRIGRKRILSFSLLLAAVLMLFFLAAEGWMLFLLLLLLGFVALSSGSVMMALVQESYPQNLALANGIYMGLSFVLRSGVTLLVGFLGDLFGLQTAFTLGALVSLSGLVLIWRLPATVK